VDLCSILTEIELFNGLDQDDLKEIAQICEERVYRLAEVIAVQGDEGNEFFIITEGNVEISVNDRREPGTKRVVANLGAGQLIGEMGLVDQGPRSATVCAIEEPTRVQVIHYSAIKDLFERNSKIGYLVMRNLAVDISFKLRVYMAHS